MTTTDTYNKFISHAIKGWAFAGNGDDDGARVEWGKAQGLGIAGEMAIEQSLLRFHLGESEGVVRNAQPTEDSVVTVSFLDSPKETCFMDGMKTSAMEFKLNSYPFPHSYHETNIKKSIPHVFVLSTGRCGTVSLYRLFEQTQYIPYHSYHFQNPDSDRFEMMCRHNDGNYGGLVDFGWAMTRAAEWLGCISVDRPMMALNHMDTIFAPTFAAIHPKSKFIYLRREPKDVFKSFYSKNQWNPSQLQPINYSFTPEFNWRRARYDIPYSIAWYLKFTEKFSREFGKIMGDRFIEISSEDLFAGDVDKLIDFTEIDLPKSQVEQHFKIKHNEKSHKAGSYDPDIFESAYAQV